MTYRTRRDAVACLLICALCGCSEGAATPAPATAGSGGAAGGSGGGAGSDTAAGSAGVSLGGDAAIAGSASGGGNAGAAGDGGTAGQAQAGQAGMAGASTSNASEGCGSMNPLPDGNIELKVGDLTRSYVVRKPENYDATKPWPLLMALHPNGATSSYWDQTSGSRAFRPLLAQQALLVMPQARDNDWRGDLPLDLAYFDALMKEVESRLCVNLKRIYSAGFSGGGSFSGVLACYRKDIRAIAVGGAVEYFEEAECVGTPAAWITIGDEEAVQGRLDFRDFWRDYSGCQTTGTTAEPATCTAYDCPNVDRPVQFCSHPAGHEWPSFGTQAAWDFLSQF